MPYKNPWKRPRLDEFAPYAVGLAANYIRNRYFKKPPPPPAYTPNYPGVNFTPRLTPARTPKTRTANFAGKVKARKRVKRTKVRMTRTRLEEQGVTFVNEYRDAPADTNVECSYIGHASLPTYETLLNLCRALVKALVVRGGRDITTFKMVVTTAEGGFAVGDIFRISYYANVTSPTLTDLDYAVFAGATYEDIAVGLAALLSAITAADVTRFVYAEIRPLGTGSKIAFSKIQLNQCRVQLKASSRLKVQNRTVNAVGDIEADDIDNVPIQGKLYKAKGNAFLHIASRNLYQLSTQGLIRAVVPRDAPLSEPPMPREWENCTKSSKLRISPGGIKTSILGHSRIYLFQNLLNILLRPTGYNVYCGEAQLMALEKVIGNYATPVLYAYELEYKQTTAILSKSSHKTETIGDQT